MACAIVTGENLAAKSLAAIAFAGLDGEAVGFAGEVFEAGRVAVGRAQGFADATPIKIRGDVEYLINRNDSGWMVTLFNNNGVFKPQQGLAQVDRSAYVNATISVSGQTIQKALDWTNEQELEGKTQNGLSGVMVKIPPGGISIIELIQNRER